SDAAERAPGGALRERVEGEEADFRDLAIRLLLLVDPEVAHDVAKNVVSPRDPRVEDHDGQGRGPRSGHVPSRKLSVPDQKDAAGSIDDRTADPERQAAGDAPIGMQHPFDQDTPHRAARPTDRIHAPSLATGMDRITE